LPIGNLTSQFFANIYLSGMDRYILEKLKMPFYLRYVDDFVCFDNHKEKLKEARANIEERLEALRLRMHSKKNHVYSVCNGIPFLGYLIYPDYRRIKKDNVKNMVRKLKNFQRDFREKRIKPEKITASIQSWIGHARWADSRCLRRKLFSGFHLARN
jgi:hypothetical protein